ncbi:MAG TPA: DHHA1 domain-containing protein [Terriglobales bacterium]|jgi:alanyl-tRNA synthetase
MTNRLYYHNSFLYEFEAQTVDVLPNADESGRTAILLNQTAFYPTSGGQVFDTGSMELPDGNKLRVYQVEQNDNGDVLHFVDSHVQVERGVPIRGAIDAERRRDHMQQHTGQHVLSAAFIRLFELPTVSFHMGSDSCTIDLDAKALTGKQVEAAEKLANQVIWENRPVEIRFVTQDQARGMGLRKIAVVDKEELRLIDIQDFDLTACGGTHVRSTCQIGVILLRKTEKVRQGWRVEFVCGRRAISAARKDYAVLSAAGGLLSSHHWDVLQQIRKSQEDARLARKMQEQLVEELADAHAASLVAEHRGSSGRTVIKKIFADRDQSYIKLLAQRLTRGENVLALLATTSGTPAMVFAASPGQGLDMNAAMKEALARMGGRGGGNKEIAQGGPARVDDLEIVLNELASRLVS